VKAHTWPGTRTLDFDDGMLSVMWAIKAGIIKKKPEDIIYATIGEREEEKERGKHGFVKLPMALDRATEQIDDWTEEGGFSTLIVDSATALNQYCMLKGAKSMDSFGYSTSWTKALKENLFIPRIQDFGGSKNMFSQFAEWTLSLPYNVIYTAHQFEDTTDSGLVRQYQPLLIGSLREDIPRMFDEVWYCYVNNDGKFTSRTVTDKKHICKSRLGCLDPEETAFSYTEIREKVKAFWGSPGPRSGAKAGTKVSVAVS